jgi:hypothetical protein
MQQDPMQRYVEEHQAAGDGRAVALLTYLIRAKRGIDDAVRETERYQQLKGRVVAISNELGALFAGLAQMEERKRMERGGQ